MDDTPQSHKYPDGQSPNNTIKDHITKSEDDHRRLFYELNCRNTPQPTNPETQSNTKSALMSFADYQNYLRILRYWNLKDGHVDKSTGLHISCQEFRRSINHSWYQNSKVFQIKYIVQNDGTTTEVLERFDKTTKTWKRVVHSDNIFDAIKECHVQETHMKLEPTKKLANEKYWNITRQSCHNFIITCPDCQSNKQLLKTPQSTKSTKPIASFFDRFHATIVDLKHETKSKSYGNMMSHVLLVVDNLSDWKVLRPLAGVDQGALKDEMTMIFCTRGYPRRINHASISTAVSRLVNNILERHQDNANRSTTETDTTKLNVQEKRVIDVIQNLERGGNHNSNWVDLLNTAMIILNSTGDRKPGNISKGIKTNLDPSQLSHEIQAPIVIDQPLLSHQTKTPDNPKEVQQPVMLSSKERNTLRHSNDVPRSPVVENTIVNQQSTFSSVDLSQGNVDTRTTNDKTTTSMQVDNVIKHQDINSKNVATIAKDLFRPEAVQIRHYFEKDNTTATENPNNLLDDEVIPYYPPNEVKSADDGKRRRELYNKYNVLTAFNCGMFTTRIVDKIPYRLCHPILDCEACDENYTSQPITIAEDRFYDLYRQTGRWFPCDMVLTFGRLCSHDAHRDDVMYVDAMMPDAVTDTRRSTTTSLPELVQTLVSVVFEDSHFAIMRLCLAERKGYIYDGLSMPHEKWSRQMEYVLRRYGIRHQEWTLCPGKGKDGMDDITIKQNDQSNCGPIACMVLWKLFKPDQMNLRSLPSSKYRQRAIDELCQLITRHDAYCVVFKRKKRIPGLIGIIENSDSIMAVVSSTETKKESLLTHESAERPSEPNEKRRMDDSNVNEYATKRPSRQPEYGKKNPKKDAPSTTWSDEDNSSLDMDEETSIEKELIQKRRTGIQRLPPTSPEDGSTSQKSWRSTSKSIRKKKPETISYISGLTDSDSDDGNITKNTTNNHKRKSVGSRDDRQKKTRFHIGTSTKKKKNKIKCKCRKECNNRCGCFRNGSRCSLECSCKGRCTNK